MLQWMGGSKKKVNTSRKSTMNRQKQYFEQRRGQQQHQQQPNEIESYAYASGTAGQHDKGNQSLDILSLLNLSKACHEQKSSCPNGTEDIDVSAPRVKYDLSEDPQTMSPKIVDPPFSVKYNNARAESAFQLGIASPERPISTAPDNHRKSFIETYSNPQNSRRPVEQLSESSLLDVFSNDGLEDDYAEGSPVPEAHVAFSVEGLGKVGMETPLQSPKQPKRTFSYECVSPFHGARKVNSFKKLKPLDDFDIKMTKGTTNVAFYFNDGIIIGVDSRVHDYISDKYSFLVDDDSTKTAFLLKEGSSTILCTAMGSLSHWDSLYRRISAGKVTSVKQATSWAAMHLSEYVLENADEIQSYRNQFDAELGFGIIIGGYVPAEGFKIASVELYCGTVIMRTHDEIYTLGSGASYADKVLGVENRDGHRRFGNKHEARTIQRAVDLGFDCLREAGIYSYSSGGVSRVFHIHTTGFQMYTRLPLELYREKLYRGIQANAPVEVETRSIYMLYRWIQPLFMEKELVDVFDDIWGGNWAWGSVMYEREFRAASHLIACKRDYYIHRLICTSPDRVSVLLKCATIITDKPPEFPEGLGIVCAGNRYRIFLAPVSLPLLDHLVALHDPPNFTYRQPTPPPSPLPSP